MTSFDLATLLQPISEESPCGEDLEYDPLFIEMEAASQGKPDTEYGDTKIPAEPPDWKTVRRTALELLSQTKDLRVAYLLACGLLATAEGTEGLVAFGDVLRLIRDYVENHWEQVHPQLDPEEGNDPTSRVNTLSSLSDLTTTIKALREAPLVDSAMLGRFSLQDIEIARGEIAAPKDTEPPQLAAIEAAFADADLDQLRETERGTQQALEQVDAIESQLTSHVGVGNATSFEKLQETLRSIHSLLAAQLQRRSPHESPPEDAGHQPSNDETQEVPQTATGEIRSREDVIRTLDRICQYYERYEQSSPLPLLLRRAQRLATMDFLDIVAELTPEGLTQAKAIGGVPDD